MKAAKILNKVLILTSSVLALAIVLFNNITDLYVKLIANYVYLIPFTILIIISSVHIFSQEFTKEKYFLNIRPPPHS